MKPIFQNSRPSRPSEPQRPFDHHISQAPMTDWSFQSSGANLGGGAISLHSGLRRPGFHTLSQGFFSAEADRESRFEGALFTVLVGLAAWPIVLAAQAAIALLK